MTGGFVENHVEEGEGAALPERVATVNQLVGSALKTDINTLLAILDLRESFIYKLKANF